LILPNFLIVGAQNCGTTSLHDSLDQHPQSNMSKVKEINFFTLEEKYEKRLDYYSRYFKKQQKSIKLPENRTLAIFF
jgi:hypothetical protein